MASRKIEHLCPELRPLAEAWKRQCEAEGLNVIIICTYRDNAEQAACYASGASNCKPGQSEHNKTDATGQPAARAWDMGVIEHGKYVGNGSHPHYKRAGEIAESLGLEWAGRWTGKLKETAHIQMKRVPK